MNIQPNNTEIDLEQKDEINLINKHNVLKKKKKHRIFRLKGITLVILNR